MSLPKQVVPDVHGKNWTNIVFLLIPLIALLVLEVFSNGSFLSAYAWVVNCPKEFLLSYVLMFGLINFFYGLPRKLYLVISCIQLGVFSTLGLISHEKLVLKGSPLVPTDFFLTKEAVEISGRFRNIYISIALIAIGIIVLMMLFLKLIPREESKWQQKTVIFLISAIVIFVSYNDFESVQKAFALQAINLSQKMNYDENGMMLGFIINAESLKVPSPPNYQEDTIKQIIEGTKASYPVDPGFKPNIIFVMSEAFWDPTLMKNVSFSQDPIPFFHSLQKSQTNGIMLSPVYGGGTANTEFEALTGFSAQFLPDGVIPYTQYVSKPLEALPVIFQRQGYATSAIHTYDSWFYNRNNVYKDFGFDKFISKEFFSHPEYKGEYIRDTELTRKILDEVKETSQPDFIYAVSMQNHGPYSSAEYPDNKIKVSGDNLSPASRALLDNYANTISDVDQSLKQLIDGLKQIKEPTEVIFYGDHLPMLGDDYYVYKEAGFIKDANSYQDYLKLHSVPFVTWNNFSTTKQHLRLSSNFMGVYALEVAKKSGSPLTDFLSGLIQKGSDVVLNQDYSGREKITPAETAQYELLQYDQLFGKEYIYQSEPGHKPPANNGYIQGDGAVRIANVMFSDGVLTIQGENFVENDQVYINGKPVKSTFSGSNRLNAGLLEDFNDSKTSKIQIKLFDSMNKLISESKVYLCGK